MLRMLGIALVAGLLALVAFQNYSEATRLAVRAKQSELEALQARVRPHFLFNTLNSGIALVRQRPEQAEELLLGLSDLFRAALARPHDVALGEELALVRRYRSEEHTSELQSLMRISYAVFCLKKKTKHTTQQLRITR